MTDTGRQYLRLAAVCAILCPLILLIADIMRVAQGGVTFAWTIVIWGAFVLFVPAVLAISYAAAEGGNRLAVLGGVSAFVGAMAGASMQVYFRSWAILDEGGYAQALDYLKTSFKMVASTQMIGIFFPLGLLIIAVSLFISRKFKWYVPLALAGTAVLFPMGRIGGFLTGIFGADLLMILAFGTIGRYLLSAGSGEELA